MKVLVLGGRGFLGSYVATALSEHEIITADTRPGGKYHRVVDITNQKIVQQATKDIDVIVNLVGLTPLKQGPFQEVHVEGVRNVLATRKPLIHISALGADPHSDIEYVRTKGRAEELITESKVPHAILRPSMLFGAGAELFRQLDTLPVFPRFPTRVQPVFAGDVAQFISTLIKQPRGAHELAGPEVMTLYEFARQYRAVLPVPFTIFKPAFWIATRLKIARLSPDQYKSIALENTAAAHPAMVIRYSTWVKKERKNK